MPKLIIEINPEKEILKKIRAVSHALEVTPYISVKEIAFKELEKLYKELEEVRIINDNPSKRVKGITPEDPIREYLTFEEIQNVAKIECRYEVLKRAFLFSCITGLRWSDINKLLWSEVQKFNGGCRILS